MAGEARERLEFRLKKPVVSSENFLNLGSDNQKPDELNEGEKN